MGKLFEKLMAYAKMDRISFAMPGHKGGRGLSSDFLDNIAKLDVTELYDTEDLHSPKESLNSAKQDLARRFGAKESFFLTGGSTEGVQIMLFVASKGGRVLANRTCHRSVVNASVIGGFDLCFLKQELDDNLLVPLPPTASEVERAILANDGITACIITSPDYFGHIADIEGISKVCHRNGIPLLVDEAHGAVLSADNMTGGAIRMGADMAVQSAHKTLNALNQSAYLHWNSELIDIETVAEMARMVGTSSPSYPIVASAEMALSGLSGNSWCDLADYLDKRRAELKSKTDILYPKGAVDRTRLVFGLSRYDITGYEAEKVLCKRYNIDVEMSDRHNIVAIVTPANTRDEIDLLFSATEEILKNAKKREQTAFPKLPVPNRVLPAKNAFFAKSEKVLLKNAVGKVAKTNITAYPPGIAIVTAGEEISKEVADYIFTIKELGAKIEGLSEEEYIEVVK